MKFIFLLLFLDIDECSNDENNECDPNALCSNSEGSYICRCLKGYNGDGRQCIGVKKYKRFFSQT